MSSALVARSIEVIKEGQAPSGAYVASPTFEPYGYCWFRDGAFVADAMSRVGEDASAEAFFDWGARVIERDYPNLDARYELDGARTRVEWPLFQLDGFGTWMWAVGAHCERRGLRSGRWSSAIGAAKRYLEERWADPTTDWWEEREGTHAATLACICGGLEMCGSRATEDVRAAAIEHAGDRVDASLLCLYEPFRLLPLSGTVTLSRIEERLVDADGGVHRHLDDDYYGGGAWIILVAWLGWVRRDPGALRWIEARATPDGLLPEQVPEHLIHPGRLEPWIAKWGPSACPLLWSHAMYLTLAAELGMAP